MFKRIISGFLCFAMLWMFTTVSAFADTSEGIIASAEEISKIDINTISDEPAFLDLQGVGNSNIKGFKVFANGADTYKVKVGLLSEKAVFVAVGFDIKGRMVGSAFINVAENSDVQIKQFSLHAPNAVQFEGYLFSSDGTYTPLCNTALTQLSSEDLSALTVGGKEYYIGMTEGELRQLAGTPDDILSGVDGLPWYVFGTNTYKNFFMAGMYNGKVYSLYASGSGFEYQGRNMGDNGSGLTASSFVNLDGKNCRGSYYVDSNDNNAIHAVGIQYSTGLTRKTDSASLANEAKLDFYMVNAFRVYHGVPILQYSTTAATVARQHSEDMAAQNYFSHTSLSGASPGDRLEAAGISWMSYGENIAAGYSNAIEVHNGWINSSGHRSNILTTSCIYLGAGGGYSSSSTYKIYFTENFYR